MSGKREQVRQFIDGETRLAIADYISGMNNREHAEAIRQNRNSIAERISFHLWSEYRFLELTDIMEWKRQRVRR